MSEHVTFDATGVTSVGFHPIPDRCPWPVGAWVRRHGYPGEHGRQGRGGWRGVVLGGAGGTLLAGVTDDGRSWVEPWAALTDDRPGGDPDVRCVCCPRPGAARPVRHVQGDLFAAVSS